MDNIQRRQSARAKRPTFKVKENNQARKESDNLSNKHAGKEEELREHSKNGIKSNIVFRRMTRSGNLKNDSGITAVKTKENGRLSLKANEEMNVDKDRKEEKKRRTQKTMVLSDCDSKSYSESPCPAKPKANENVGECRNGSNRNSYVIGKSNSPANQEGDTVEVNKPEASPSKSDQISVETVCSDITLCEEKYVLGKSRKRMRELNRRNISYCKLKAVSLRGRPISKKVDSELNQINKANDCPEINNNKKKKGYVTRSKNKAVIQFHQIDHLQENQLEEKPTGTEERRMQIRGVSEKITDQGPSVHLEKSRLAHIHSKNFNDYMQPIKTNADLECDNLLEARRLLAGEVSDKSSAVDNAVIGTFNPSHNDIAVNSGLINTSNNIQLDTDSLASVNGDEEFDTDKFIDSAIGVLDSFLDGDQNEADTVDESNFGVNTTITEQKRLQDFTEVSLNQVQKPESTTKRTQTEYFRKKKQKSKGKSFQCEECGKIVSSQGALRTHRLLHLGKRPFVCEMCGLSFAMKYYLSRHQLSHSGKRRHVCNICGKKFLSRPNLTSHLLIHSNDRPYSCETCGKKFKTPLGLYLHAKLHNAKTHVCDVCGKGFVTRLRLQGHKLKTHSAYKPYTCEMCGKSFPYSTSLEEHLRRHAGDKPETCTRCGKGFNNKRELRAHMKYHELKTEFHCKQCDMCYKSQQSLNKHLSKTHGVVHTCTICGNSFTNLRRLQSHKFREHKTELKKPKTSTERPASSTRVTCSFCKKDFCNRYVLSKHLINQHNFSVEAMKTLLQIRDKVTATKADDTKIGTTLCNKDKNEKNFKVYYKDEDMAVFVKMGNPNALKEAAEKEDEKAVNALRTDVPELGDKDKFDDQIIQCIYVDSEGRITKTVKENVLKSRSVTKRTEVCDQQIEEAMVVNEEPVVISDNTVIASEEVIATTVDETVDEQNNATVEENVYIVVSGDTDASESITQIQISDKQEDNVEGQVLYVVGESDETITLNGEEYVVMTTESDNQFYESQEGAKLGDDKLEFVYEEKSMPEEIQNQDTGIDGTQGVNGKGKIDITVSTENICAPDPSVVGKAPPLEYTNDTSAIPSMTEGYEILQNLCNFESQNLHPMSVDNLNANKAISHENIGELNAHGHITSAGTSENIGAAYKYQNTSEEIAEPAAETSGSEQITLENQLQANDSELNKATDAIETIAAVSEGDTKPKDSSEAVSGNNNKSAENEDLNRFARALKSKAAQFSSVEEYNKFLDKMMLTLQQAKNESEKHFVD